MSEPLWTFDDFVAAMDARVVNGGTKAITGVSIDSRTIAQGEAFFAIRGENFDGHQFVTLAFGGGASAAVIAEARLPSFGRVNKPLVLVDDVLQGLERLGQASRQRTSARIAAVTGSVGKTGTKAMLSRALGASGSVHASPASFNNHWGVPLSLSRMPQSSDFGVFEIGMNHAGEITPLVKMVRPHAAIITTVEPVHLEYFDSVEDIARAKAEIFLGLEPHGSAILNRDNPHFGLLADLAHHAGVSRIVRFGEHEEADVRLEAVDLYADRSRVLATLFGEEHTYEVGAPGRHLVQNSLAVLAAVAELGADVSKAKEALGRMTAPQGRGARMRLETPEGSMTLIDESYNANPASMRAAIAVLGQSAPLKGGRRIAVLGEMRELGEQAVDMHAGLAEALVQAKIDAVFAAGPLMRALFEALPDALRGGYAETAAELEPVLAESVGAGDVVMVKGSHASRMGPLVASLKERFAASQPADDGERGAA